MILNLSSLIWCTGASHTLVSYVGPTTILHC